MVIGRSIQSSRGHTKGTMLQLPEKAGYACSEKEKNLHATHGGSCKPGPLLFNDCTLKRRLAPKIQDFGSQRTTHTSVDARSVLMKAWVAHGLSCLNLLGKMTAQVRTLALTNRANRAPLEGDVRGGQICIRIGVSYHHRIDVRANKLVLRKRLEWADALATMEEENSVPRNYKERARRRSSFPSVNGMLKMRNRAVANLMRNQGVRYQLDSCWITLRLAEESSDDFTESMKQLLGGPIRYHKHPCKKGARSAIDYRFSPRIENDASLARKTMTLSPSHLSLTISLSCYLPPLPHIIFSLIHTPHQHSPTHSL